MYCHLVECWMAADDKPSVKCFTNRPFLAYVRYFHTEWTVGVGITGTVRGNAVFFYPPSDHSTFFTHKLQCNQCIFPNISPLHSDNHTNDRVNTENENKLYLWYAWSRGYLRRVLTFVTIPNKTSTVLFRSLLYLRYFVPSYEQTHDTILTALLYWNGQIIDPLKFV
jgi:hypothetical protein